MKSCVLLAIAVAAGFLVEAAHAQGAAPDACPPTTAKVATASRVDAVYDQSRPATGTKPAPVQMGDTVELVGPDLGTAAKCGGTTKPLVLFLGNIALPGLLPETIEDKSLRFRLTRDDASKAAWSIILGRPRSEARQLSVSVGLENGQVMPSDAQIGFIALPEVPSLVSLVGFLGLLAGFVLLAKKTNIIRDGNPEDALTPTGKYSLSKTQAAWWFFTVLASYLFIGIVTGDFKTSLNGTALTLLAIGGGTAIGSALIASSRENSPDEVQAKQDASDTLAQRAQTLTAPAKKDELAAVEQSQAALEGRSKGFIIDILSDVDGVCFHRFQNVAWTVTLTGIFITAVYKTLAMPDFDATLLGLLGISSLTYLGLKPTEATIPQSAKTATGG